MVYCMKGAVLRARHTKLTEMPSLQHRLRAYSNKQLKCGAGNMGRRILREDTKQELLNFSWKMWKGCEI